MEEIAVKEQIHSVTTVRDGKRKLLPFRYGEALYYRIQKEDEKLKNQPAEWIWQQSTDQPPESHIRSSWSV